MCAVRVFFLQRAAYAPRNFLEASRPPWFNVGSQQDCSEYLRFLLDRYASLSKQSDESLEVVVFCFFFKFYIETCFSYTRLIIGGKCQCIILLIKYVKKTVLNGNTVQIKTWECSVEVCCEAL